MKRLLILAAVVLTACSSASVDGLRGGVTGGAVPADVAPANDEKVYCPILEAVGDMTGSDTDNIKVMPYPAGSYVGDWDNWIMVRFMPFKPYPFTVVGLKEWGESVDYYVNGAPLPKTVPEVIYAQPGVWYQSATYPAAEFIWHGDNRWQVRVPAGWDCYMHEKWR
jgi:hypothetical protein